MVRFSCFAPPIHYHRPKKVVQHFDGPVHTNTRVASQDQEVNASSGSAMLNPKTEENNPSSADQITSPSSCWKSEDLNDNLSLEDSKDFRRMLHLKKSQSFGNILEEGRGFSFEDDSEDNEIDQKFSFGNSCDKNMQGITDSLKNSGSAVQDGPGNFHGDLGMNLHHEENVIDSFDFCAELMHHESLFSIGILKQFDGDQADDAGNKSADHFAESGCRSSETLPVLVRSRSVANLRINTDNFLDGAPTRECMGPRSRSFEDFNLLSGGRAEFLNRDAAPFSGKAFHMPRAASYSHDMPKALDLDEKRAAELADAGDERLQFHKSGGCNEGTYQDGDVLLWREKGKYESHSVDGDDSRCYGGLMNEWRQPKTNNLEIRNDLQPETSVQNRDELISKEFNIKRIEEWISQIDIQNGYSIEEPGESSNSVPNMDPHIVADVSAAKVDAKNSPGMEAAYNYISSLTAASSSAQMANLGLVVVPFLGALISLKVLNLSGNSIVRITAGALPRGLHVLNLSKNNISTIEGLRELTRLRVLDLSYNRISRIGHGLASCSSLKELYLAGNKISEVEGLHRLLKLNILDLRLNKISTSKGLGQLAANYTSLQAINLDGNPAQRNVGDEHLKKYLVSLLPNLVYFNKQTTRAVSMKEVPDRSTRSIIAHQFDRGMRSENKPPRRGAHGSSSLHKSAASSSHHRLSHAQNTAMKHAKSRHGQQPLAGSRITHHLPNISSKPLSLHPRSTIRRIRSEGTL